MLVREKTQTEALKSVAGLAQHSGHIALINQQYYTIHSPDAANGVVMLRDVEGRDHLLSAFESSLRDIAVFSRRERCVSCGNWCHYSAILSKSWHFWRWPATTLPQHFMWGLPGLT